MHPIASKQVWSANGHRILHTVKTSRFINLEFDADEKPIIVPYQILGFWTGTWLPDEQQALNNSIMIPRKLIRQEVLDGIQFLRGDIDIELHNVSRKRILNQGTTNIVTWDIENTQNLIIGWNDRQFKSIGYKDWTSADVAEQPRTKSSTLWDYVSDLVKKEELPPRHCYKHTVTFPTPSYNQAYKPNDYWDKTGARYLVPGITGQTQMAATDEYNITTATYNNQFVNQTQEIAYQTDNKDIYSIQQVQPLVSYPRMLLGKPEIKGEAGNIKLIYKVKVTTNLHTVLIFKPDIESKATFRIRQWQELPVVEGQKNETCNVPCHPYIANF